MGLSMADLERLEVGMVMDLITESSNDREDYTPVANQADFDRF